MKLGKTQQAIINALKDKKEYYVGCGWYWHTDKQTIAILNTLVRRGLVAVSSNQFCFSIYKLV